MKVPLLFSWLALTSALVVVDSSLASSCIYYMKQFNWGCGGTGQGHHMYACRCANVDWLGAVTGCMESEGSGRSETLHAFKHLATRCTQKAGLDYSVSELAAYASNASSYMEAPPRNLSQRLHNPVSVNYTDYAVYKRSFNQINHHVFKTQWFGWGLVFFWGAIIAALTVSNFLWSTFRVSVLPKNARQLFQKHMMRTTALFGLSRADVLVMALFTIQTVLSTAVSYTVELPNKYINDRYFLTLDLIGYRSGIIAFSLMPIVYVFGLRNNPFCFLTGLPQSVFITYHKFVGIIMALEALVHSSVWTAYAIRSGGYAMWAMDDYWKWGVVGTTLLFIMLGHSIGILRNLMYEAFVWCHKIFGWLFILAMWYHCIDLGWMGWVYSLIAFTAYDRAVRLFKMFFINRGYTQIEVNVVDDKVVKLTVPKSILFDACYTPGSHVFISFYHWPIWYQCLQSHPFTIVSCPFESAHCYSIYVRVKKGSTKALARLQGGEKGKLTMWSLIDGPYGPGNHTYTEDDYIVGITGGLGICALLPTFYENPSGSTLYWAVNNFSDVEYLHANIMYLVSRGTDVKVFMTRKLSEEDSHFAENYKYLTITGERPDVAEWVKMSHEIALNDKKSNLFVLSCGPGHMDKEVQESICDHITVGSDLTIYFQKENYQW